MLHQTCKIPRAKHAKFAKAPPPFPLFCFFLASFALFARIQFSLPLFVGKIQWCAQHSLDGASSNSSALNISGRGASRPQLLARQRRALD
jgi:hypothetical protein